MTYDPCSSDTHLTLTTTLRTDPCWESLNAVAMMFHSSSSRYNSHQNSPIEMPQQHPRPPHHPAQQQRAADNAPVPARDPHDPTHVPYVPAPPSINVPTPTPMRLGFHDPPSATGANLPRLLPTLRWNGGSGARDAAPAPPSSAFELVSTPTASTTLPLLR
jgi:hypothetical protein